MRRRLAALRREPDAGNAIVEFVFVAVLVMVPLVYLIVAVASVQASSLAVGEAARQAGRAFATAGSTGQGVQRAQVAVRLALADQNLPDDVDLRFVPAGASCRSAPITPALVVGSEFTVCVTRRAQVPAIPAVLAGRGITSVGRFTVHVDDYRTVGS